MLNNTIIRSIFSFCLALTVILQSPIAVKGQSTMFLDRSRIGEDMHLAICFRVLDADEGLPIRGAQITLADNQSREYGEISVDSRGLALVVFRTESDIWHYSPVSILIRSPNYTQTMRELDEQSIYNESDLVNLWIPRESYRGAYSVPTDQQFINAIKGRLYSSHGYDSVPRTVDEREFVRHPQSYYILTVDVQLQRLRYRPNVRYDRRADEPEQVQPTIIRVTQGSITLDVYPTDLSPSHWSAAVAACARLEGFGYDDWYLPSREELEILYKNRGIIPGLENGVYWSSTVASGNNIWAISFRNDGQAILVDKSISYSINTGPMCVRAVRRR